MEKYKNNEVNDLLYSVNNLEVLIKRSDSNIDCLSKTRDIMLENNLKVDDITELIEKYKENKDKLLNNKKEKETEIEDIRNNCVHSWVEEGHDSHHTYYVCEICGELSKY